MDFWIRSVICIILLAGSCCLPVVSFGQNLDLTRSSKAIGTSSELNPEQALSAFETGQIITGSTNFGFSQDFFWIKVSAPTEIGIEYILDVDNPHIDRIEVWSITDSGFSHLGISGDRIAFSHRTHSNRRNIFKFISQADTAHLLIMADKRNAAVAVPLKLWEANEFEAADGRYNMYHGLYFGMLLLIVLYSVLIFALQRQSVYLWYAVYVAALFIYLFVHVGYGFQFLFPEQYEWNNYLRLIMLVFIMVAQIRFTQLFLPIKATVPWIHRVLNWLVVALIAIVLWWILVPGLFTTYTIFVINAIYAFIALSVTLLVLALIRTWHTDRVSSLFYIVAFGANILAAILMILEEYGMISLSDQTLRPLFIGSFLEIVIFAIGLSYRSKLIVDDRQKLLANIGTLQNQALSSYLRGVEEEKGRVSKELHDDIAARLGAMKLKIQAGSSDQFAAEMEGVIEGVRSLSHELSASTFSDQDFVEQLRKNIEDQPSGAPNIELQVFDVNSSLTADQNLQLIRIVQEAFQNIRKHASATRVDVQFFEHETAFVLTIEDNGAGFDMQRSAQGIGLRNMSDRAESINAEFSISSAVGEGTSIMVSVPKS